MPHIIYKGMDIEEVKAIENEAVEMISELIDCPVDHFTSEWIQAVFISEGKENKGGYPFVTINWFERPMAQQIEVATYLTEIIKRFGYQDVCVYFNILDPNRYFENGTHF